MTQQSSALVRLPDPAATATATGTSGEVSEAVLEAFEDALAEVVADAWQDLAELPGYRDLAAGEAQAVRDALRRSTLVFVTCLREGRGLNGEDREYYRGLGADRAWKGIPIEALEHAFRAGYHNSHRRMERAAHELLKHRPVDRADQVRTLNARMLELFPAAWTAAREGYEAALVGELTPRHVARRRFVTDVLDGAVEDTDVEERLRRLGVRAPDRWQPLVVVVRSPSHPDLADSVEAVLETTQDAMAGPVRDGPVRHAAILVPATADGAPGFDGERVGAVARRHDVTVVAGTRCRLELISPTYRRLRGHLDLIARIAPTPGILSIRKLVRHAVLAAGSRDDAAWFVGAVLAPVLGPCDLRWDPLATLFAVHDADGDRAAAADALDVSERTVRRRIRRVSDLLAIDPNNPVCRGDVATALRLLRLHGDTLPPPHDLAWTHHYVQ